MNILNSIFPFFFAIIFLGCTKLDKFLTELNEDETFETSSSQLNIEKKIEDKNIQIVQKKISSYQDIKRVEIRNYLKNQRHHFQSDIKKIKKIKTVLNPIGKKYLEINFFTNEQDLNAPLVAQFILIEDSTKNIIEESSLNINLNDLK